MIKFVLLIAAGLLMVGCQHNSAGKITKAGKITEVSKSGNAYVGTLGKGNCKVQGLNWKSSNARLKMGLCALSRRYGTVYVTSSCRTKRQNRSVKRSYHLHSRGCKAADVRIKGVKGKTILKWWGRNMGGGRGFYSCRGFVHVDTGENRTWSWNLCKKRKRSRKRA